MTQERVHVLANEAELLDEFAWLHQALVGVVLVEGLVDHVIGAEHPAAAPMLVDHLGALDALRLEDGDQGHVLGNEH